MHWLTAKFFSVRKYLSVGVCATQELIFFLSKLLRICVKQNLYITLQRKKVEWTYLDSVVSVLGLVNYQRKGLGFSHIKPPLGEEIL